MEPWTSCLGARVLIVDDDAEMRSVLATTLSNAGCHPILASSGAEAVRIAEVAGHLGRASLDLLLIDLRMPGHDGLSVLRLLRRAGLLPPAILMTAFPDDVVRADALMLGTTVLEKPFEAESLRRLAALLVLSKRLDAQRAPRLAKSGGWRASRVRGA